MKLNLIIIQHGLGKKISEKSGVSQEMVSRYLNGKIISARSLRIRRMAIEEFGGVEVPTNK